MVSRRHNLVVVLASAFLLASCGGANHAPAASSATAAAPGDAPQVVLPDGAVILVEVVADPETRALGLMHRPSLRPDRGMLFLFPDTNAHSFWMKNTLIPLDMIWIDAGSRVVDVRANVPPCEADPCPSYAPSGPARHVLELAAGQAAAHGLGPGDQVTIRNVEQYPIR